MKGFSTIEILAVLGIFSFLSIASVVTLGVLREGSDLQSETEEFQSVLELARSRTIASEGDAKHGVYVDISASPHEYVLFQGDNYASRVVSEDEVYGIGDTIEFDPALLSFGGGQEVVFERIEGNTSQSGSAVLRVKADPSSVRTVYVESSGVVEIDTSAAPSDADRQKDTRHMHVIYQRQIDTTVEVIELDFENNGTIDETIVVADYLSGGQILWEGTIDVAGESQTLKIHTHRLNDVGPETEFSIHRDRRFNTKALTILVPGTVSDPDSGTLIQYDSAGVITNGTSAYVLATQEQ